MPTSEESNEGDSKIQVVEERGEEEPTKVVESGSTGESNELDESRGEEAAPLEQMQSPPKKKELDETSLLAFKAITDFATDLHQVFGKDQKSLRLYCSLLEHTSLIHVEPIQKHIAAFRKFCVENRKAILDKSEGDLVNTKIKYSEKVFIDVAPFFKIADVQIKNVIWKHLLTISALTDPSSKAKKILLDSIKRTQARGGTGSEEKFLTNIFDKVNSHVDPDQIANPMEAVSSIMNSGIFSDLLGNMNSGLQSGELDLGRLFGAFQGMLGSMNAMGDGNDDMPMPNMGAMFGNIAAGMLSGPNNEAPE